MKIYSTVIKKITTVVQQVSATWLPKAKPAVQLKGILMALSNLKPAVRLSTAPAWVVTKMLPAINLKQVITGAARQVMSPAPKLRTVLTPVPTLSKPAAKIVQYTFNLTGTYGGAVVVSQTGWTNPNNALGKTNGTNATVTGSATAATGGALVMSYPAQPNKAVLTISAARLDVYGTQAGTTLANGNYKIEYSIDAGTNWVVVTTQTGNFTNFLNTDLTTAIAGSWTNVANFRVRITASYAAANLSTATLDAAELIITASLTATP